MKVRFAISPGPSASRLDGLGRFVTTLERLGFDGVWLSDIPLGAPVDPLVGLSFAAAATSRLKLGTNLVPLGRHPLILAKALAQLDQLSAGRLLLSFVVGIDQPGERAALGIEGRPRGALLEDITTDLRAWWDGRPLDDGPYAGIAPPARPVQRPLEVWFGGRGPAALRRVGRLADGWLGSAITPEEAGVARGRIEEAATAAGRQVDPEHFGLSIPYAPTAPDPAARERLRAQRPDVDPTDLLPVGPAQLRDLIGRLGAAGLSKFVVRPVEDDDEVLGRLADVLLPLQT